MSASAGVNAGWWTPDNEAWFRKRRNGIREGTEQPLTTSNWLQALKGQKRAARLKRRAIEAADNAVKQAGIEIS